MSTILTMIITEYNIPTKMISLLLKSLSEQCRMVSIVGGRIKDRMEKGNEIGTKIIPDTTPRSQKAVSAVRERSGGISPR